MPIDLNQPRPPEYERDEGREVPGGVMPEHVAQTVRVRPPIPVVTFVLLGLNVAMYLAGMLMSGLLGINEGRMLIILGAKVNAFVAYGEWWRLLSCMFLHAGIAHLLFNMLALFSWGRLAEALYGRAKFLLVYLAAGLCGSVASFALSNSNSVGASGAVFGLLGAMLYVRTVNKTWFNRFIGMQLFAILGINIVYGFMNAGIIDNFAHIGGLVGGLLVSFAAGLKGDKRMTPVKALCACALVVLAAVGVAVGLMHTEPIPPQVVGF